MSVADVFGNILLDVLFQNVDLRPISKGVSYVHRHYLGNMSMDEVSRSVYSHASQADYAIQQSNRTYQHAQEVPAGEAPRLRAKWKQYLRKNALCQTRVATVLSKVQHQGPHQAEAKVHFENAQRCLGRADRTLRSGLAELDSFHPIPKQQVASQFVLDQTANLRRLAYIHPMRAGGAAASAAVVLVLLGHHMMSKHAARHLAPVRYIPNPNGARYSA